MLYYDTYDWTKVENSSVKPEEIETDSSYYVWLRKDITEKRTKVEPPPGDDTDYPDIVTYDYLEKKITLSQYLAEQQKINRETNEALMLGLCDIYTMQLGE